MTRWFGGLAWAVVGSVVAHGHPPGVGAQIAWDDPAVRVEAEESFRERYRNRDALVVRNGTVWIDDVETENGVVEFALAAPARMGFHGVAFRAVDREGYEHVYVRPHLTGRPDAVQYTPVFHGVSGWQIYAGPRFVQQARIPSDRWIRVRLTFHGRRAELTVDGERVVFPGLVRSPSRGTVGLTASGAPARFADLTVREDAAPVDTDGVPAPEPAPARTVSRWRVSIPFAEERLPFAAPLDPEGWADLEWDALGAGERGIANLARLRRRSDEANTAFAAVTIRSARSALVPVGFGFSDRVTVYLNGRPVFRADDGWRTRDYRFLGTVGLHDALVLPLERGPNELWLAVSEGFGGWGVTLQLPERAGVEVVETP